MQTRLDVQGMTYIWSKLSLTYEVTCSTLYMLHNMNEIYFQCLQNPLKDLNPTLPVNYLYLELTASVCLNIRYI